MTKESVERVEYGCLRVVRNGVGWGTALFHGKAELLDSSKCVFVKL